MSDRVPLSCLDFFFFFTVTGDKGVVLLKSLSRSYTPIHNQCTHLIKYTHCRRTRAVQTDSAVVGSRPQNCHFNRDFFFHFHEIRLHLVFMYKLFYGFQKG